MLTVTNKIITLTNESQQELELEVDYELENPVVVLRTDGFSLPLDENGCISAEAIAQLIDALGPRSNSSND
jgi:hypothetical protein